MERITNKAKELSTPIIDKAKELSTPILGKAGEAIQNPYVVGVLAILITVYGSFMAPKLPPSVAVWFNNPIFKVLFIFLIIFVHRISPIVSILLGLAFVISVQTMSRYKVFDMVRFELPLYKKPNQQELAQVKQELTDELGKKPASPKASDSDSVTRITGKVIDGLHPLNRPTEETLYMDSRVLDPNDPTHPAAKILDNPNIDVAVFELNPPFAKKELPESIGEQELNTPVGHAPKGGPTRYSAYHGYLLV